MSVDAVDDLAFFGLGIWSDGETWACGSVSDFGSGCTRRCGDDGLGLSVGEVSGSKGRVHECDGGGAKLCLGRDDLDGVAEDVDGRGGRGHVVVVWRGCCRWDLRERMETLRFFRPLLSCSEGASGFFRW